MFHLCISRYLENISNPSKNASRTGRETVAWIVVLNNWFDSDNLPAFSCNFGLVIGRMSLQTGES
jgi:hypothetical protein